MYLQKIDDEAVGDVTFTLSLALTLLRLQPDELRHHARGLGAALSGQGHEPWGLLLG